MVVNLLEDADNQNQTPQAKGDHLREIDSTSEKSEDTVHLEAAKILMDLKSSASPSPLETSDKEATPTEHAIQSAQVKPCSVEEQLPPGATEQVVKKDTTCLGYNIGHPTVSYETHDMGKMVVAPQFPKEVEMVQSLPGAPHPKQYAANKLFHTSMDHYSPEPLATFDDSMVGSWDVPPTLAESHVRGARHALGSIVLHPGVRRATPYRHLRIQTPHPHSQLSGPTGPYGEHLVRASFQYSHCAPLSTPSPPVRRVHRDLLTRPRIQLNFPQQPAVAGASVRYYTVHRPGVAPSTNKLAGHWWGVPDLGIPQGFQPYQ